MAMIPYEELVASLHQWRVRQGLATGPSDYLGMRTFDIGAAADSPPVEHAYSVGDSTSEVDASDLEVVDEELAEAVSVDAYSASDEGFTDYGQTADPYGDQPAYEEAPAAYDEQPAYEEAPAAYDEQPAYEAAPAYDEQPAYDDASAYEAQPSYEEQPLYEEAPAAYDEQPAYEEAPAAYDEQPAYDEASAYEEAPAAFDEQPAYDDASAYEVEAEPGFGDADEATVIAGQPGDADLGADFGDASFGSEPPPLAFGDDIEVSGHDDEATRVGSADDPAPPPLAPPPDDELP